MGNFNETTAAANKPNLSFGQIWNMCFGFFGIQFGWSLQMGNMSAIYEFLGANPEDIPGLWLAAPMTGLLIQPIVGFLSDRTWHPRWGRRRPYFLIGAILSSIALFFMPNSPTVWIAAGTLWILDSCINISMEPFRAFVADNLNEKQRSFGYAMQSMFIGAASFLAGFLPTLLVDWFGVTRQKINGGIPGNIAWSFYIGAFVFLIAVLYTVFKSKEYPPDTEASLSQSSEKNIFIEIILALKNMPSQMKRLALVQFLTWPGLFLMWFYYGTGVAVNIFGGNAKGVEGSKELLQFSQGLEFANTTSAILNLVTFLFSFAIPFVVGKIGNKFTHTVCLVIGGIGLISVNFIQEPSLLLLSMSMVGIAWASILSMPYTMLAGSIPPAKMGIYMGIFNFFIVLPEIIASLTFGKIMSNYLNNDRLVAVMIGGFLLITAGIICALIIKEEKHK